jgi:hypothetical protein
MEPASAATPVLADLVGSLMRRNWAWFELRVYLRKRQEATGIVSPRTTTDGERARLTMATITGLTHLILVEDVGSLPSSGW